MSISPTQKPVTPPGTETRKEECLIVCTKLLDEMHSALEKNEPEVLTSVPLEEVEKVSRYKELDKCIFEFKNQDDPHIKKVGRVLEKIFKICRNKNFERHEDVVIVDLSKYPKLFDSYI